MWVRQTMATFHNLPLPPTVELMMDNGGSIAVFVRESVKERSKHVAIKFHFCREQVRLGTVTITYCPTELMIADPFKKSLTRLMFFFHRTAIRIGPPPSASH